MNKKLFDRLGGSLLDYLICSGAVLVGGLFVSVILMSVFYKYLIAIAEFPIFALYSLAYMIPLYFVHFKRNAELKRFVLGVSEDGFNLGSLIRHFTKEYGIIDICAYAAYVTLGLSALLFDKPNPLQFIAIQAAFTELPIPFVLCVFSAVLIFTLQYYLSFIIAAHGWYKKRLHK